MSSYDDPPRRQKPVEIADVAAGQKAEAGVAATRAWWRRVPMLLTDPRPVFAALCETDEIDMDARSEPILAIVIVAGMAGVLLTPEWGHLLDDGSVDALVIAVVTFIGGLIFGAFGYFVVGLAVWLGARSMGSPETFRRARQVAGFAALPFALSIVITLPLILGAYGGDWFRSGGSDHGAGRLLVTCVGLAAAVWSLGLLVLGLRTTLRLPWRGVAGAILLAGVFLAVLVVLPAVL